MADGIIYVLCVCVCVCLCVDIKHLIALTTAAAAAERREQTQEGLQGKQEKEDAKMKAIDRLFNKLYGAAGAPGIYISVCVCVCVCVCVHNICIYVYIYFSINWYSLYI